MDIVVQCSLFLRHVGRNFKSRTPKFVVFACEEGVGIMNQLTTTRKTNKSILSQCLFFSRAKVF